MPYDFGGHDIFQQLGMATLSVPDGYGLRKLKNYN